MKITNRIEEKDEHLQRLEILNQNSSYLEWILGLIECLAFHDHHQWNSHKINARKMKNKSGKRKKNEEQLREKENSLILKLTQQVSKTIFVQNEVTN